MYFCETPQKKKAEKLIFDNSLEGYETTKKSDLVIFTSF